MEEDRISQLQAILAENPTDKMARYALAMELLNGGQNESAMLELRKVLSHDPGYVPAYQMLAQAMMRKGLSVEAKEVLDRGIQAAAASGNQHAQREMLGMLDEL